MPTIAPVSAKLMSVSFSSVALATPKSITLGVGPAVHLRHQHVARLEVAMDDPLLVGVLDGLADRHEQLQPGCHRHPCLVAILGDRHALHQLHDEEGLVGRRDAAVVDAGDVGVIHQREGLPFGVEPGQHASRIHRPLDQLERHLPLDRFGLAGTVDRAHPAFAQDVLERIPSRDDLARHKGIGSRGASDARGTVDRGDFFADAGGFGRIDVGERTRLRGI